MKPQIFVLTGETINSYMPVDALMRVQRREEGKAPYDFDIVKASAENLSDILKDPRTIAGIIPGSDSSQNIRNQIGPEGLSGLRDFVVKDGGALAGFCAGGYLMGEHIVYGDCFPPEHRRSSSDNLGLIEATYYGPLTNLVLDYAFKHPARPYISIAKIDTNGFQGMPVVYWHGGIALLPKDQKEMRPLATFCDEIVINTHDHVIQEIAPIAIGVKDFPSGGKALSSTVHPEVFGDYLDPYIRYMASQPEHPHYSRLQIPYQAAANKLKAHKNQQYHLFREIVDELLDCGKAQKLTNKTLETTALTR